MTNCPEVATWGSVFWLQQFQVNIAWLPPSNFKFQSPAAVLFWSQCHFWWSLRHCAHTRTGIHTTDNARNAAAAVHIRSGATNVWADPRLCYCRRQSLDCPTSQRFHLPQLQQKRTVWHGSAEHSWAGPSLWCCHHHCLEHPTSQHCHLPRLRQKLPLWHGSAEHSNIPELIADCVTVAAIARKAPCDHHVTSNAPQKPWHDVLQLLWTAVQQQ